MAEKNNKAGQVAVGKRAKISKTQQETLAAVLVASIVLGVMFVLGIYMIKMINFNGRIIGEKDKAIADYEQTIKNVGVCVDGNNDGSYNIDELKSCNPNIVKNSQVKGSLRYKIMEDAAKNEDLESVGRESLKECYGVDGKKKDFLTEAENVKNEKDKRYFEDMFRICSALRVIPESMPASNNPEALMASLNQIFIISKWEMDRVSPSENTSRVKKGLGKIPLSVMVEADSKTSFNVLNNIEKSIRTFEIERATITWSGNDKLSLSMRTNSYFMSPLKVEEKTVKIYASEKAEKAAGGKK